MYGILRSSAQPRSNTHEYPWLRPAAFGYYRASPGFLIMPVGHALPHGGSWPLWTGADTLRGTNGDDKLVGRGGNDILLALAGNDNLLGGSGKDVVNGGSLVRPFRGDKNLVGGRGNDAVQGGLGSDNVVGGEGNDFMVDGEFTNAVKDNLSGGDGNDGKQKAKTRVLGWVRGLSGSSCALLTGRRRACLPGSSSPGSTSARR
jgi:hypothetical protein